MVRSLNPHQVRLGWHAEEVRGTMPQSCQGIFRVLRQDFGRLHGGFMQCLPFSAQGLGSEFMVWGFRLNV